MEHNDHIRLTWARAVSQDTALARQFYTRLFTAAPAVRPLFQSDMDAQGAKLVATLNFIVDHLDAPETLLPAAEALALRHVDYGVQADHYGAVGGALIETLQALLGPDMTSEAQRAWAETYTGLTDHMIAAAYPKG
ncbi:MAG: globin domain-containing protein [Pseudomonadota bacterium]